MTESEDLVSADRFSHDGVQIHSLFQANELPDPVKEGIYRHLLPAAVLVEYGIDPETLCDGSGNRLVTITCPEGTALAQIDVRHAPGAPDPLLYLELSDNRLNQIEILLFLVNDPDAERFDTDRDWHGERTKFGTFRRNIDEEIRAMEAGLAPGQVRKGLRLSRSLVPLFERFVQRLGHDHYLMDPLAYHNAVLFERLGFNYLQGLRKMQWIHLGFQPGGLLHERLDGSTPFRSPDAWQTVRGRSWAIHDGILDEPWSGVRMYKRVSKHAGVDTFPGGRW